MIIALAAVELAVGASAFQSLLWVRILSDRNVCHKVDGRLVNLIWDPLYITVRNA